MSDPLGGSDAHLDDPSSERKVQDIISNDESPFIVKTLSTNVISDIFAQISTKPLGFGAKLEDARSIPFSFYKDSSDNVNICLPMNLETFADSPVLKTVIAAGAALNASFYASKKPIESIKYLSQYEQYFLGLAAVFKLKEVDPQPYTGMFGQGYNWALTQNEFVQKHKKFFKVTWKTPHDALLGRSVWTSNCEPWQRNFYNLVLYTAKHAIKVNRIEKLCKSYQDLKSSLIRTSFNYEKGAVFISEEIATMQDFISHHRDTLKKREKSLKQISPALIEGWDELSEEEKFLLDYDNAVGAIASQRAMIIYSPKAKKKVGKGAVLLSQRLQVLSLTELIQATNPSGLTGDNRLVFTCRPNVDSEELAEEFQGWVAKSYPDLDQCPNPLIKGWVKWINSQIRVANESEQ
jgi:virulence-associated protein VapD